MIGPHIPLLKKHLYGKFRESYTFSVGKIPAVKRLKIHIERVIRRLREFSMLQPCANLNSNYIKHLDSMVTIAAALRNL